jgi:hypothetical protein
MVLSSLSLPRSPTLGRSTFVVPCSPPGFGSTSSRSGRSRRLPFLCADPWQPWSDRRAVREVVSQLARTVTGGTESPESSSSTEGPPKPWWSSHPGRQGSKSRRLGATNRWARSSPPVTLLPQGCCSRGLLFPAGLLLLPAGHAPPRRAAAPAGLLLPVGLQLEPTAPGPRSVRFPVRCSSPLLCSLLHKDVNRQLHMFALLAPQWFCCKTDTQSKCFYKFRHKERETIFDSTLRILSSINIFPCDWIWLPMPSEIWTDWNLDVSLSEASLFKCY